MLKKGRKSRKPSGQGTKLWYWLMARAIRSDHGTRRVHRKTSLPMLNTLHLETGQMKILIADKIMIVCFRKMLKDRGIEPIPCTKELSKGNRSRWKEITPISKTIDSGENHCLASEFQTLVIRYERSVTIYIVALAHMACALNVLKRVLDSFKNILHEKVDKLLEKNSNYNNIGLEETYK